MTDKTTKQKESSVLERTLLREDFRGIVATNLIKSDSNKYGTQATQNAETSYDALMNSEYVQEIRKKAHQSQKAEYAKLGVAGESSYMSNQEISALIITQINEVMEMSKLGDLYAVVKKIAPGLDIKIDERIKGFTKKELLQSAIEKKAINEKGELDSKKLSKEEQMAIEMYQNLSQAYKEIDATNLRTNALYARFNEMGSAINKELNPEPEKV